MTSEQVVTFQPVNRVVDTLQCLSLNLGPELGWTSKKCA